MTPLAAFDARMSNYSRMLAAEKLTMDDVEVVQHLLAPDDRRLKRLARHRERIRSYGTVVTFLASSDARARSYHSHLRAVREGEALRRVHHEERMAAFVQTFTRS